MAESEQAGMAFVDADALRDMVEDMVILNKVAAQTFDELKRLRAQLKQAELFIERLRAAGKVSDDDLALYVASRNHVLNLTGDEE
jgi:hypothetical protein